MTKQEAILIFEIETNKMMSQMEEGKHIDEQLCLAMAYAIGILKGVNV